MADIALELRFEPTTAIDSLAAETLSRPGLTSDLRFEAVSDASGFRALQGDWNHLTSQVQGFRSVFQDFNWLSHWLGAYLETGRPGCRLAMVVGRTGSGEIVLIAPFQIERRFGVTELCWMGCPVAQYGDIIVASGWDRNENINAAIRFAVSHYSPDVVRLCKVREDAQIGKALVINQHMPEYLHAREIGQDTAFELDFSNASGFADYEKRYSAKSRKNRRRLLRRLTERYDVAFHAHKPGEDAASIALEGLELKRAWLEARGMKSSALEDRSIDRFMACAAADPSSGCRIFSLRCDGQLAGVQIGFERDGRLELFLIVFNLEFEKAGIGALHLEDTFRAYCNQGGHCVDLLAPDAAYKREWADRNMAVTDYAIPCTLAGRAYTSAYLMGLRKLLKSAQDALPLSVRKWALKLVR